MLIEDQDRGEYRPCVATNLLTKAQDSVISPDEEDVMKHVCAVAVEDTTGHTLEAFCLAMALYPDVQKKAQAELDQVVGPDRLPDHTDTNALIYINAIVKEALRWHVVVPQGISHRTIEDDELNGYFIPGGTTIMTNVWYVNMWPVESAIHYLHGTYRGFLHDPKVYENPFDFSPERFIKAGELNPDVRDPTDYMFGFGRSLPLDHNGKSIPIKYQESHGLTSYPEDFRCVMTPRSAASEALIREAQHAIITTDSI
ncbi:cytochrome P450 [Cubamyces sp. BRFM 1775]|nr:cytochrome P450 [Cubamyces sp. BRFM 1775]